MKIRNLPVISARYWIAILVASMCGANTGDFLSHNLNLAIIVACCLWQYMSGHLMGEKPARIATEAY